MDTQKRTKRRRQHKPQHIQITTKTNKTQPTYLPPPNPINYIISLINKKTQ